MWVTPSRAAQTQAHLGERDGNAELLHFVFVWKQKIITSALVPSEFRALTICERWSRNANAGREEREESASLGGWDASRILRNACSSDRLSLRTDCTTYFFGGGGVSQNFFVFFFWLFSFSSCFIVLFPVSNVTKTELQKQDSLIASAPVLSVSRTVHPIIKHSTDHTLKRKTVWEEGFVLAGSLGSI